MKYTLQANNGPKYVEISVTEGEGMADPRPVFPLAANEQQAYQIAHTFMKQQKYDRALQALKVEFPNARLRQVGE